MTIRFGDLEGRGPIGLKGKKTSNQSRRSRQDKLDPDYLVDLRRLPCVICEAWGYQQTTPTQAHHWICGRYGQYKAPDQEAIPLCESHHQGEFDPTKIAIHRDRALWVETYGPDTDYIAIAQDAVARLRGKL